MGVEEAADLYGLPLEEFTQARNELSDRLKAQGSLDESKRVRALKKPSLPAWTINQLARHSPEPIAELFRLRDEIESASSAAELRTRTEERRKLLSQLTSRARKVLMDGGHAPAAATIEKVSQSLLAADDSTQETVVGGTLEGEVVAGSTSFGAFGSFDAATVTFDKQPDGPDPHLERLKLEAEEAEYEATELEEVAKQAETAAQEARDRAVQARRKATRARDRVAQATKG
jgi:folylpolyglutamate synthase/dihydropteroate synthase